MDFLSSLGSLTLELHRGARAQPVDGFIDWAFETLKRFLPFDSGLWGAGHVGPDRRPVVHTLRLHRQPAQLMLDYAGMAHEDVVFQKSLQNPGCAVVADSRRDMPALWHDYIERYGIWHVLTTCDIDGQTGLINDVALWRADQDRPFSEDERRFMQAAFPHLIEACTQNRLLHLLHAATPHFAGPWRAAASDRTGLLHVADSEFSGLLRLEWPEWVGPQLPEALAEPLRQGEAHRFVGQRAVFKIAPMGELLLVQARQCAPLDRLSQREREVALYTAQGLSHKEIARLIELSPATVRNHLAAACRRIGVRSKAQIAALVQSLE